MAPTGSNEASIISTKIFICTLPALNAAGTKDFHIFFPDLLMPTHSHDGFNLALKSTIFINNICIRPANETLTANGKVSDIKVASDKFPTEKNTKTAPKISAKFSKIGVAAPGQNIL